jgi:hypothetical protein
MVYRSVELLSFRKKFRKYLPFTDVVKKQFCITATSVPSEKLFSAAGDLILDQRSRLSTYHVDMLLFLNKNACSQKLTNKSSGLKSLWGMGKFKKKTVSGSLAFSPHLLLNTSSLLHLLSRSPLLSRYSDNLRCFARIS